jgi:putative transposase
MSTLYKVCGISKQSFHQYHNRLLLRLQEEFYLMGIIAEIRRDHPTMGCRDMYFKIHPTTMGRDAFESFCREAGLMTIRKKNYIRTTDSSGVIRFENLTVNLNLTAADQLWVSDITYFEVFGRFYYLTFIMDAFTKRIIGHSVSKNLVTETTTLTALQMAIKTRGKESLAGLIFHSDGGGQYYDKAFLKLTNNYDIKNSMCKYPWENPYAERVNGVIKSNYLDHREIETFEQLKKQVDLTIKLYNYDKPHKSLKRLTPVGFENCILALGKQSDGDKSAMEHESQRPGGYQPFGLMGNNPRALISLQNMKENIV